MWRGCLARVAGKTESSDALVYARQVSSLSGLKGILALTSSAVKARSALSLRSRRRTLATFYEGLQPAQHSLPALHVPTRAGDVPFETFLANSHESAGS